MATKTISITEDAYRRLANQRIRENESFSEVINREFKKKFRLRDFHGIISKEAADALENSMIEDRKIHRELHEKRIKRLEKEFNGVP